MSGFRCDGYEGSPKLEDNDSPEAATSTEQSQKYKPEQDESDTKIAILEKSSISDLKKLNEREVTALVVRPNEPYVGRDRLTLKAFVELTALMVGRSDAGAKFWQVLVPQAAWTYPSVRHAMLAAALSCQSLIQRNRDSLAGQQTQMLALKHATRSVQSLLHNEAPLDVTLLTSATLGIMELFNGCWDTACTHVTYGAKLAKQTKTTSSVDPFITFYCEAFASLLPTFLSKESVEDSLPGSKSALIKLEEAVASLILGIEDLDRTSMRLVEYKHVKKDRILHIMQYARFENEWILARWQKLLTEEASKASRQEITQTLNYNKVVSPWSSILLVVNDCIDRGADLDVTKFEVAMERNLPFYTLAKSGSNVKMREDATQLMYMGAKLRGRASQKKLADASAVAPV